MFWFTLYPPPSHPPTELVANIIEREDDVEPIDESLLFEQQKILEDMVHNSDLSDLETTDHDAVTSEAQDSGNNRGPNCKWKSEKTMV